MTAAVSGSSPATVGEVGAVLARQVTPIVKSGARPKKPRKALPKVKKTTQAAAEREATRLWGQYIHARDGERCRHCGRGDVKVEAHHMIPRDHKATRADETNGVLLCYAHHKGRDGCHGDPKFAVDLYSKILGVDGYEALRAKAKAGVKTSVAYWQGESARLRALLEQVSRG